MKKAAFYSIMALALVLGLTLAMAVPVAADQIEVRKTTILPWDHVYEVGHTIQYVLNVTNIDPTAVIVLDGIWDTRPNGIVLVDPPFVDPADPSATLTLEPGESWIHSLSYIVSWDDAVWITPAVGDPYWVVINRLDAAVWDGYPDGEPTEHRWVTVLSYVDPPDFPPVGGVASPVSRLALLVPWIILAGVMAGAAVFVWSRKAQGRA